MKTRMFETRVEFFALKNAVRVDDVLFFDQSKSALNSVRAQAVSANIDAFHFAVDDRANTLNVRLPSLFRADMRMAHLHTRHRALMANLTVCRHLYSLPSSSRHSKRKQSITKKFACQSSTRVIVSTRARSASRSVKMFALTIALITVNCRFFASM